MADMMSLPVDQDSQLVELDIETGDHFAINDESMLPYRYVRSLGHGANAVVEKIEHTATSSVYARKIITIPFRDSKKAVERCKQEIRIIRRLAKHRHMIQVVASYSTKSSLALILHPAADGGTLETFLENVKFEEDSKTKTSMKTILRHAYGCLASGLSFIHQHKVRHRDIKPSNILVHSGSILYADFGIAKDYSDKTDTVTTGRPDALTRKFCAPEVQDHGERSSKTDIFSLGCVYLLMYAATFRSKATDDITEGRFYEEVDKIPEVLKNCEKDRPVVECIKGMLKEKKHARPSANDVTELLRPEGSRYFCGQCQLNPADSVDYSHGSTCSSPISHSVRSSDDEDVSVADLSTSFGPLSDPAPSVADAGQTSVILLAEPSVRDDEHPQLTFHDEPDASVPKSMANAVVLRRDSVMNKVGGFHSMASDHQASRLSHSTRDRLVPVQSPLSNYGVRRYKLVRFLATTATGMSHSTTSQHQEQHLYEDDIYERTFQLIGLGIRLSKRKPYGSILPSLRTYPVKSDLDEEWALFQNGDIPDIQRAFATKALHPYMQDHDGQNLLDIAIAVHRLDLCHLLVSWGVQPSLVHEEDGAIYSTLSASTYLPTEEAIDMLRFAMGTLSQALDVNGDWANDRGKFVLNEEITHWLLRSGPEYYLDTSCLHEYCLRLTLRRLNNYLPDQFDTAKSLLQQYLSPDLVARIQNNELVFLDDLFFPYESSDGESRTTSISFRFLLYGEYTEHCEEVAWDLGYLWLSILSQLGVDIPLYLAHELESHPGNLLVDPAIYFTTQLDRLSSLDRVIIYAYSDEKGYMVGWRYDDEYEPAEFAAGVPQRLIWKRDDEWLSEEDGGSDDGANRIPGSWVD